MPTWWAWQGAGPAVLDSLLPDERWGNLNGQVVIELLILRGSKDVYRIAPIDPPDQAMFSKDFPYKSTTYNSLEENDGSLFFGGGWHSNAPFLWSARPKNVHLSAGRPLMEVKLVHSTLERTNQSIQPNKSAKRSCKLWWTKDLANKHDGQSQSHDISGHGEQCKTYKTHG